MTQADPELQAMGIMTGFDPLPMHRARILWLGEAKVGKTTAACSFPDALLLDAEEAGCNVWATTAARKVIRTYADYETVCKWLARKAVTGPPPFKHIIVDTADRLQHLAAEKLTADLNMDVYRYGRGTGFQMVIQALLKPLRPLFRVGYGVSVVSHLRRQVTTNAEGDTIEVFRPAVFPSLVDQLYADADYVLRVVREFEVVERNKRLVGIPRYYISCLADPNRPLAAEVGMRIPLPAQIPLSLGGAYAALEKAWSEAVSAIRDKRGQEVTAREVPLPVGLRPRTAGATRRGFEGGARSNERQSEGEPAEAAEFGGTDDAG